MDELEAKTNLLEKELARSVSGFGEAIRQATWQEVQSFLKPGETAIEFIHFEYSDPEEMDSIVYAALLLRPGQTRPTFIPLCGEKEFSLFFFKYGRK